jgi:hypothetical protein
MRRVEPLPGALGNPAVLDQMIEHGLENQAFLLAGQYPVTEYRQQRRVEGVVLCAKMQGQTPALVVLHGFGRLLVGHAKDELQNQYAEQANRIPCRPPILWHIQFLQSGTVRLQQGEDGQGEKDKESTFAANGYRNALRAREGL